MCETCGCSPDHENFTLRKPGGDNHHHTHEHGHDHNHDHEHDHEHEHTHSHKLESDVLINNRLLAERNRGFFDAMDVKALNLVSSPGSGKTSLLERTLSELAEKFSFYVIEGDQQTTRDADRISATGAPVIQVNTGNGCHLDAAMVNRAAKELNITSGSVLFIENVGNLVCPALFDLGEKKRVVIISVTEGDDKPLKYPNMFHSSDLCIINKTDLLPYVDFSTKQLKENALKVNRRLQFIELSVKTGDGCAEWYQWIENI
jgi:hydrogenase nickel incorporation protein HypB